MVARHGVVLATGGFAANNAMSAANRQGNVAPHYSMVPRSCAGDGIRLGVSAGGVFGEPRAGAFFWAPVSVKREADGTLRRFAHLTLDRAKPGIIAVDRNGRRFTNEADSYHRFGEALAGTAWEKAVRSARLADMRRQSPSRLRPGDGTTISRPWW